MLKIFSFRAFAPPRHGSYCESGGHDSELAGTGDAWGAREDLAGVAWPALSPAGLLVLAPLEMGCWLRSGLCPLPSLCLQPSQQVHMHAFLAAPTACSGAFVALGHAVHPENVP